MTLAIYALDAHGRRFPCCWRTRDSGERVLCTLAGPVTKAVPLVVVGERQAVEVEARLLRKMGYAEVMEERG